MVDDRGVAGDHAGSLEAVDPPLDGRRRQADPAPISARVRARVGAEAVDEPWSVSSRHSDARIISQVRMRLVILASYASLHGYVLAPDRARDSLLRHGRRSSRARRRRSVDLETLEEVQRRVLWLATSIVHHANKVRQTPVGREGRRPSGVVGVDGVDHDRAVLRAPARPPTACRSSRTPRRCCTRSTTCSAGSTART